MSICYYCKIPIYGKYQLCRKCAFDPNLTISFTDIKKKFKLTSSEIQSGNLFYYCFNTGVYSGTKYIFPDILKIAEKLTEQLDDTNKKKQAYFKQKSIWSEYLEKQKIIDTRKNNIINQVDILMSKYEYKLDIKNNPEIALVLQDISQTLELSEYNGVLKIINILEDHNQKQRKKASRKKNLDDLITQKIPEIYQDFARSEFDYKYLEKSDYSAEYLFQKIQESVNKEIIKTDRKTKLDNLIEKNIPNKYKKKATSDPAYYRYINYDELEPEICLQKIQGNINFKLEYNKRKRQLDYQINKNIDLDYKTEIKDSKLYTDYLNGQGELKEILEKINKYIENKKSEGTRQIALDQEINKQIDPKYHELVKKSRTYKSYITSPDLNLAETMEKINKTVIFDNPANRTKICFQQIKKLNSEIYDQYIDGEISYDTAIKNINGYDKNNRRDRMRDYLIKNYTDIQIKKIYTDPDYFKYYQGILSLEKFKILIQEKFVINHN